jgi:hypothetical protein
MPYLHFEPFSKRRDIRKTIREVHASNITADIAKRNAPEHLTRRTRHRLKTQFRGTWNLADTSDRGRLDSFSSDSTEASKQQPIAIRHIEEVERNKAETEKSLIKAYLHNRPPLHVRRSLAEFHYLSLNESAMEKRDQHQVAYRFRERENVLQGSTHDGLLHLQGRIQDIESQQDWRYVRDEKRAESKSRKAQNNTQGEGNYPIVMVDQLWMWIIGHGEINP